MRFFHRNPVDTWIGNFPAEVIQATTLFQVLLQEYRSAGITYKRPRGREQYIPDTIAYGDFRPRKFTYDAIRSSVEWVDRRSIVRPDCYAWACGIAVEGGGAVQPSQRRRKALPPKQSRMPETPRRSAKSNVPLDLPFARMEDLLPARIPANELRKRLGRESSSSAWHAAQDMSLDTS